MKVMIMICVVLGLPGVGKTHLMYLLLDKRPPCLRTSTMCAETPIKIEVRNITGTRVRNIKGSWKEVDSHGMFDVVAEMILLAEPDSSIEVSEPPKESNSVFTRIVNWMKKRTSVEKEVHSASAAAVDGASAQVLSSRISDACLKAMNVVMAKVVECITKMRGQILTSDRSPSSEGLKSKWVYFTDSGGQPQYHELLPLFVRRISSALCVVRLPDKLDEIQSVEYFKEGERVGTAQHSQFSAIDTVQCLVNTVQSYSAQDQPPKIIIAGTHLDKLEEKSKLDSDPTCEVAPEFSNEDTSARDIETLEDKDKKLLEMLEPDFSDQLVFYSESSSPKKLIFPLNTLNPGEQENTIAQSIRFSVETSGAKEVKVPIWWYILELLLQELAKELGRGVLSRAECLEMARLLDIKEDSFDAALVYFDELNVIKYSPSVLPNVVFIDSQVPLDKVSELVYHSYLLRQPTAAASEPSSPIEVEWRHFRDQGVVSKDCLKKFDRHYVADIFCEDDLIEYLKQRLVFAPIPRPEWAPSPKQQSTSGEEEETHYVVPSLLLTLSKSELEERRITSSVAATLLVRFPHGSRRAGVFCCFVVHLIRHCGWSLLLDATEPLYRNCIKMRLLTNPPISAVLIDSNSYIEVHVNATTGIPVSEYAGLLPIIKQAILSGIFAACSALNYKQTKPHLTFYCPHTRPSVNPTPANQPQKHKQHTATLTPSRQYWRCDLDPDTYFGLLEAQHTIWFGMPQGS